MATPTIDYQHRRLSHDDEIRLVRILPGQRGEPVRCRLLHARLKELGGVQYSAISYVWGSPSSLVRVECSELGDSLLVTQNCYAALIALRNKSENSLIWIDAVAIDQAHISERNHQVLLMRRIYSAASKVIIFLGDGPIEITRLLHRIKLPRQQMSTSDRLLRDKSRCERHDLSLAGGCWTSEDSDLMACFLQYPYWRRMWIVQEIYAASRLELMFNNELFDEDLIREIVRIRSSVMNTPLWFPLPLTTLIREPTSHWQWNLWNLLTFTRAFNTSDARDRVIALLGLAEGIHHGLRELLTDYNTSADRLFQRLALYFFLQAVGIRPEQLCPDRSRLATLLDSTHIFDGPFQSKRSRHVLQIRPQDLCTETRFETCSDRTTQSVLISRAHSKSQFDHLWRRCHDFLDVDLPFANAITFGDILQRATETEHTSPGAYDGRFTASSETFTFRIAVTAKGQILTVHEDAIFGSSDDEINTRSPIAPMTLVSNWMARCSDITHYDRPKKECCADPTQLEDVVEWQPVNRTQNGPSLVWQITQTDYDSQQPCPAWSDDYL